MGTEATKRKADPFDFDDWPYSFAFGQDVQEENPARLPWPREYGIPGIIRAPGPDFPHEPKVKVSRKDGTELLEFSAYPGGAHQVVCVSTGVLAE